MAMLGYTKREADGLKREVETEISKIEEAANRLRQVVSDTDPNSFISQGGGVDGLLESFREIGHGLNGVIDRRTRQ